MTSFRIPNTMSSLQTELSEEFGLPRPARRAHQVPDDGYIVVK